MLARYMLRNKKHKNIFKKTPKNKNSTIYVNNMVRSESVDYFSFFEAFEGTGHYLLLC